MGVVGPTGWKGESGDFIDVEAGEGALPLPDDGGNEPTDVSGQVGGHVRRHSLDSGASTLDLGQQCGQQILLLESEIILVP